MAGIPDEAKGEVGVALVVPDQAEKVDEEELMQALEDSLEPWQVPARLVFVDSLPRSSVGKILRDDLLEMAISARNAG